MRTSRRGAAGCGRTRADPSSDDQVARYVLTRLLLVVPTLFGVTLITFALTYLLPGNPALVKAGPLATPQHIADMERQMGLDQPVVVQYGRYVGALLRGDLGESTSTGRPVLRDFLQHVPAKLEPQPA